MKIQWKWPAMVSSMACICTLNSYSKVDPTSPSPGDYGLHKYKASSYGEAALLLISPPHCYRSQINTQSLDDSQWWQELKHIEFESVVDELSIVTNIWTTNRWALDYRPAGLPQDATYAINTEWDGYTTQIRENFQFRQSSSSGNARESLNSVPYTLLASQRRVKKRKIGLGGAWFNRLKVYRPILHSSPNDLALRIYGKDSWLGGSRVVLPIQTLFNS
jgi:hypothetical protein